MFQSQLQRERDFNQKILNTTQSMILVLDTRVDQLCEPRCYEAGYRKDELIGHRLVEWVESSHRSDFDRHCRQPRMDSRWTTWNYERGGRIVPWTFFDQLESDARRSEPGEQRGGGNDDITDAALLQAKLAHAEKMATIGRLVSA